MSEYIRRLLAMDFERERPPRRIDEVFDLGTSGGSDVRRLHDDYAGEAALAEWYRETRGGAAA